MLNSIDTHNKGATPADKINLKGMMVGNGVTNWLYDTYPAYVKMSYWHSLFDGKDYDLTLVNKCNWTKLIFPNSGEPLSKECDNLIDRFSELTQNVNIYDIFGKCYGAKDEFGNLHMKPEETFKKVMVTDGGLKSYKKGFTAKEYTPWIFNKYTEKKLGETPPCIYAQPVIDYFNQKDVRSALKIPDKVPAWDMCSGIIDYTRGEKAS